MISTGEIISHEPYNDTGYYTGISLLYRIVFLLERVPGCYKQKMVLLATPVLLHPLLLFLSSLLVLVIAGPVLPFYLHI